MPSVLGTWKLTKPQSLIESIIFKPSGEAEIIVTGTPIYSVTGTWSQITDDSFTLDFQLPYPPPPEKPEKEVPVVLNGNNLQDGSRTGTMFIGDKEENFTLSLQNNELTTAIYGGIYDLINNLGQVKQSNLNTAIFWAFNVNEQGDILSNNVRFAANGVFNPDNNQTVASWPCLLLVLNEFSNIRYIYLSLFGDTTFQNIQNILQNSNSINAITLKNNISVLLKTLSPYVNGFDFDCENIGEISESTIVSLAETVFESGGSVTFCPYYNPQYWVECMKELQGKGNVAWWNLQCYDGGAGNDPNTWASCINTGLNITDGAKYIVPGLAVLGTLDSGGMDNPSEVCQKFSTWSNSGFSGGFLWDLGGIMRNKANASFTLTEYITAITNGLQGKCG